MSYQPPRRTSKLAGIIIFATFIIVMGMTLILGLVILGDVFSTFDKMTNLLTVPALAVYNFLRVITANTLALMATILVIAAVGTLIGAIFSLRGGREDQ